MHPQVVGKRSEDFSIGRANRVPVVTTQNGEGDICTAAAVEPPKKLDERHDRTR